MEVAAGSCAWKLRAALPGVPPPADAGLYAQAVRCTVMGVAANEPLVDLQAVCKAAGMVVHRERLRAAVGGIEAMIAPLPDDRFRVVIDPEPYQAWQERPGISRDELERQRFRFRLAHELAHTFFYERTGGEPRRRLSHTQNEERFCDNFARALLLPDAAIAAAEPTPDAIIDLQRRFDVSLETAVRGFASVHGDAFFSLLVANGPRPPHVRPQWHSSPELLPPRWWTAPWLQSCLDDAPRADRTGLLGRGAHAFSCVWRALPARGQVVIVAPLASTSAR